MFGINNISIRNKFIFAFSSMMLFTVGLGCFTITRIKLLTHNAQSLHENVRDAAPLPIMERDAWQLYSLAVMAHAVSTGDSATLSGLPADEKGNLAAAESHAKEEFETQWNLYVPTMNQGRETMDGEAFSAAFEQLDSLAEQAASLDDAGNHDAAGGLVLKDLKVQSDAFEDAITDDYAYQKSKNEEWNIRVKQAATASIWWIIGVVVIMLSGALIVVTYLILEVVMPLIHMAGAMRKLSSGNLNVKIPGLGRGDEVGAMASSMQVFKENAETKAKLEAEAAAFQAQLDWKVKNLTAAFEAAGRDQKDVVDGLAIALAALAHGNLEGRFSADVADPYRALKADFNAAVETLERSIVEIAANTQHVRGSADEITQAADDLSSRTERQAAALEQTAAALNQITETVQQTAEGATKANQIAADAKADAEHSNEVVKETVEAIHGIATSSKQIAEIIGLIDEIAFQTNLLALNAGIEAARAGDAGRGFAVVATEVRSLAQRSAEAAKQINAIISSAGQRVEAGVKLVDETGAALGRIIDHVAQLSTIINEISAAAKEQAAGMSEVNSAVSQMDKVTQENAAMVEQTTAASHGLAQDADELAVLVGKFRVRRAAPAKDADTTTMPALAGLPQTKDSLCISNLSDDRRVHHPVAIGG